MNNVLRIRTVNNYSIQTPNLQPFNYSDTIYTWFDVANRKYLAQYAISSGQHRSQYLAQPDLVIGIGSDDIRDNFLKIYPNPASEIVNLSLDVAAPTYVSIVLSDVMGKKVFSREETAGPSNSTIALDLAGLPKGIYILTVNDGMEIIGRQRLVLR